MADMWEQIYKCDDCKATFKGSEIKLEDPAENISIGPGCNFLYLNKNKVPTGGSEMPSKDKGDKILACPECGMVHLFGMDVV